MKFLSNHSVREAKRLESGFPDKYYKGEQCKGGETADAGEDKGEASLIISRNHKLQVLK